MRRRFLSVSTRRFLSASLPGLTPQVGFTRLAAHNTAQLGRARVAMQSILLRKKLLATKMDARVKLAHGGVTILPRRAFITLLGGAAAAWPLAVRAQRGKSARIGVLALTSADAQSVGRALREGLSELGYAEQQNFTFEFRSADGNADRLSDLAAELVRLPVDVIVATFTPCALAAKRATTTIPIIMAAVADPVGAGLVQSLARPGGNITGFSNMAAETAGKSIEFLRDMLPSLRRVAVLANPVDPFTRQLLEQVHLAGRTAGIEIAPVVMASGSNDVEASFAVMKKERAEAVVVQGIFFSRTVADVALKHRLPSASVLRQFAEAGGLMSYGADVPDIFRRSALLVHRILQGTKPTDLPVELPTKFEFVINLKTAKALGLDVPWFSSSAPTRSSNEAALAKLAVERSCERPTSRKELQVSLRST